MSDSCEILKDVKFNMEKIVSIFDSMINAYHNPTHFIANADSLIQSLRNFTFYLQSKKNDITNFEAWYKPWQELMKANPYMRFIVDMRNSIVKQGINTAKSHALIVLYTDYTQTILEKKMNIYSTTDDIKKEIAKRTIEYPALKHATGNIQRQYIFNYDKKDDLEVVDTLFYCLFFIQKMLEDFENFLNTGNFREVLPNITAPWLDVSDFAITFKVGNGDNVNFSIRRINRDGKAIEKYKRKYGDINLEHDIKSSDTKERLSANIELAQLFKKQFNELLPKLEYYSKRTKSWGMMFPMLTSRAEKILFWENFSNLIIREQINKFYLTVDAWIYEDLENGVKTILDGKEISSLPDLKEMLLAYYLDDTGKIIVAKSKYSKSVTSDIVFESLSIEEDKPVNNAMFMAVFSVWGVEGIVNSNVKNPKS